MSETPTQHSPARQTDAGDRRRGSAAPADAAAGERLFLDALGDPAAIINAAGEASYVNAAFCRLFGGRPRDWMGRMADPRRLLRPGTLTDTAASDRYCGEADTAHGPARLDWRESPLAPGWRLITGRDISQDQRPDNADEADTDETANSLIATMSHEMRTPLNGILGMTGLLLDTELSPSQQSYAEAVHQSGTALLALINDILDISKISAGRIDLDETAFEPRSLIEAVTELLSPRCGERGLDIAAYVAPDVPARLIGDEARLRQVLLNLAGNGVKFTETGGVAIELSADQSDPPTDGQTTLRIDVIDTGVGIAEDDLATVFDEFAQAPGAQRQEGTGLGLAIVRRIVQAMGGDIHVQSQPGRGSVFSVIVPMKCAEANTGTGEDIPPVLAPVVALTPSPIIARTLRAQLGAAQEGERFITRDPKKAAAFLARHRDGVLLCDLPMAEGVGAKLAARAARALVMLPPTERQQLERLREAGFDGYLVKPIRQATLASQLQPISRTEDPARDGPGDAPSSRTPAGADGSPSATRRYSILLAEDNEINAVLATTVLTRRGHRIDRAANGRDAVAAMDETRYDLVLMDMHMPIMDGVAATAALRARGHDVPVIALTANALKVDRHRCTEAGMNDFLSKPFTPADLESIVARWAGKTHDPDSDARRTG